MSRSTICWSRQSSDGVIQLSDGCLCCTVRGELVDTLADLVDRLQTGRIARLARVVIETTGLADPAPVLQSIMAHPALVQAYRLDGVVTLVDAVNARRDARRPCRGGEAGGGRRPHRAHQGRPGDDRGRARRRCARGCGRSIRAPRSSMSATSAASVASLFECGLYDPATKTADVRRWLGEEARRDHRSWPRSRPCTGMTMHHDHRAGTTPG